MLQSLRIRTHRVLEDLEIKESDGSGLSHVQSHGRRDQKAFAICLYQRDRRPAELDMEVVVLRGVVIDAVVIGNQRHTDSSLCPPDSQAIHPCSEHYVIALPVSTKLPVCPAPPDNP